jgi:acyl-coenzyme A synthetase/AMP-(fatty) acid ligase
VLTTFTAAAVSTVTRLRQLFGLKVTRIYEVIGSAYADRPLLFCDEPFHLAGYDSAVLTGRQIRDLGYRISNALRELGVHRNTRVVIAKRNHADYLLYLHSTILAGGIPININAATGWPYIALVAGFTQARFVVVDHETLLTAPEEKSIRRLSELGVTLLVVGATKGDQLHEWAERITLIDLTQKVATASPTAPPRRNIGRQTIVAMFHTSGTTGTPKLCVWTGRNTTRIWKIMMATLPLGARSRFLLAVPFSHALAFALGTGALLSGSSMYCMSSSDPRQILHTIERYRVTSVMAFPHIYMRLASEDLDAYDLSSMKIWSTGADKVHAAHIARFVLYGSLRLPPWRAKGSLFIDSYGSTEIGAGGIFQVWLPNSDPVPCIQGKPLPTQFAFRIVDEDWSDIPRGQEGRILVRSSTYFDGYWNNHGMWAEGHIDGWWWAGDVGRIDERGRLVFLDREIDSVRTPEGVLRTLPFEERLLSHPGVMEAAVFQADTDAQTGLGRAVAWVTPRGALTMADMQVLGLDTAELERELLKYTNAVADRVRLSSVHIVPLEEIPFGVTGKVLKRRLREVCSRSSDTEERYL